MRSKTSATWPETAATSRDESAGDAMGALRVGDDPITAEHRADVKKPPSEPARHHGLGARFCSCRAASPHTCTASPGVSDISKSLRGNFVAPSVSAGIDAGRRRRAVELAAPKAKPEGSSSNAGRIAHGTSILARSGRHVSKSVATKMHHSA
jgi:hypothetical protein